MDKERLTPLKAIRKFCISCQGESMKGVRLCQNVNCVLWGFRMGHKPKGKVIYHTDQERTKSGLFLPIKTEKTKAVETITTASETNKIILKDLGIIIMKIEERNE